MEAIKSLYLECQQKYIRQKNSLMLYIFTLILYTYEKV